MTNVITVTNLGTLDETVFSLTKDSIKPLSNLGKTICKEKKTQVEEECKVKAEDEVTYQIELIRPRKIKQNNNMKTILILSHLHLDPSELPLSL